MKTRPSSPHREPVQAAARRDNQTVGMPATSLSHPQGMSRASIDTSPRVQAQARVIQSVFGGNRVDGRDQTLMSTVGQVTQRAFKQAGTVYSGKKPPNRETTDGWFGRMEKPSFTSYQFYCAMKALAEVQEKPEEKTIEDLKNFAVAYLLKHSEIPQDEVNNDLEQDVDNESLDEESLEGVLDTGETTSGVTWAITGTVGRISGKALDSLLIIPNVKQDQIESALNQDPISVDGIWDRIRDIGGGVFELKINHTKTKRCEGRKGDGGLIEFTQKATKGRGK